MGTKYSSQAVAGYNAAPPPDDGSVSAANKISWATIKTKLPDPILTLAQAINTALLTALDVSNTSKSSAYTTLASDHLKPIEVSGGAAIHLASVASVGAGYQITIVNTDLSLSSTVDLALAANTFDGSVGGSTTLAPGQSITVAVNVAISGYYTVSRGWGRGGFIVQEQVQFNAAVSLNTNISLSLSGTGAVAAGASAAQGFTFSGDLNTGLGWIAADVFGGYTAGGERWRTTAQGFFKATNDGVYNGQTDAYHELYSSNNGGNDVVVIKSNAATVTNQYGAKILLANDPNDATRYFLTCIGSATKRFGILSNGGKEGFTANDVNLCDAAAKVILGDSEDYTEFVKALQFKKSSYVGATEEGQLFDDFVAQDLEAIDPSVVTVFQQADAVKGLPELKGSFPFRIQQRINSVIPRLIARIEALEAK